MGEVNGMNDFKDPAMKRYFDGLSAHVQESIKQSGVQPGTLAQLEALARNLTDRH